MTKLETEIARMINEGAVGVIPTDTLYGLVGSALLQPTVEKIYEIRKRDFSKPLIVLIADMDDLKKFNVQISEYERGSVE